MSPEKQRRMNRYRRERKDFRLTTFATSKLRSLSDQYETNETAIVEAAIHGLYNGYRDKLMSFEPDKNVLAVVNEGKAKQTIANNLGI